MKQPIIFSTREFRTEFIEKIKDIAPDYQFRTELAEDEIDQVEIAIGWKKPMNEKLLNANSLKWLQAISAGVDYLPLDELREKNIALTNGSGIHATAISEHILAVLLAYYRGIITSVKRQEQQDWQGHDNLFYGQLSGKKILIVGTGQIGQKTAQSAKALGMQIFGINTSGHAAEGFVETYSLKNMVKIVDEMDIVVNILPLTEETTHIYDATFFQAMKTTGVFVNVGRGPSVVEKDLVQALDTEQIAFAALDVFQKEPLPADSPLWSVKNLLITQHISGMTNDFQRKFMEIFLTNLKSFVKDGSLEVNQVDLKKGY